MEEKKEFEGLSLCVLASDMSDPEQLGFKWIVENVSSESLNVKLEFENPGEVSVNLEPDELIIEIDELYDEDGDLIVKDYTIRKELPTQMPDGLLA